MGECMIVRRGGTAGVPDGMTVTPTNDVKLWLKCAGVNYQQSGSPSLATVVADATLCATLMSSQNAVNYMIRSTAIQTAVLGSATAIAALDASGPYNNPDMTSNTAPDGYVSTGYQAFNSTGYLQNVSSVQLEMPEKVWIYKVTSDVCTVDANTGMTYEQGSLTMEGSSDGSAWTQLAAQDGNAAITTCGMYFKNIRVTASGATDGRQYLIGQCKVYGKRMVAVT